MKFKDLKIGDVFQSKCFGEFVIVKIIDSQNVYIRFPSTGYTKLVEMASIRLRSVKDWMKPTVYGISVKGDELPAQIDGKMVKEYVTWKEMLRRIADEKSLKQFPTYVIVLCVKDGCIIHTSIKVLETCQVTWIGITILNLANTILIKILRFQEVKITLPIHVCLSLLLKIH